MAPRTVPCINCRKNQKKCEQPFKDNVCGTCARKGKRCEGPALTEVMLRKQPAQFVEGRPKTAPAQHDLEMFNGTGQTNTAATTTSLPIPPAQPLAQPLENEQHGLYELVNSNSDPQVMSQVQQHSLEDRGSNVGYAFDIGKPPALPPIITSQGEGIALYAAGVTGEHSLRVIVNTMEVETPTTPPYHQGSSELDLWVQQSHNSDASLENNEAWYLCAPHWDFTNALSASRMGHIIMEQPHNGDQSKM